jgi:penicillin-binding protein 1C
VLLKNNKITGRQFAWLSLCLIFIVVIILFILCLPAPLFKTPFSIVLLDNKENLLSAKIAEDGQWRFPDSKNIPEKFSKAIIAFEDKRFYRHIGVDVFALGRAALKDIKSMSIKSGGSTITMQVIRISRNGKPRTIWEKIIEMFMALRLEIRYSKKEILSLYISHAPFGGNIAGVDAAAWRYFGKSAAELSWGEAATLAVLPNSPSLIRPGKNATTLLRKRNALLEKLKSTDVIDETTLMSAKSEQLPSKPFTLPRLAPHLLMRACNDIYEKTIAEPIVHSTIDREFQIHVNEIIERHHNELTSNGINNAAAIVVDVTTGNVLAYTGNISSDDIEMNADVDIIAAARSTGSILKPFLFASMLSEGEILPGTLIPDVPTQIAGYSPQNFNRDYDGAVPARRALERSLNIPAVRMLRDFGTGKFNYFLKKLGMTTLNDSPDHYGLSIILGGAEGSLWDIAGMYASMCRVLNNYSRNSSMYDAGDIHQLQYIHKERSIKQIDKPDRSGLISAGAVRLTLDAMEEVSRPELESNWKEFSSSKRIAWKTGTSFGFRDGWAVGCTPHYVVAVWTGNADGEGRPGLTGIATAAPVLFEIFNALPSSGWFEMPYDDLVKISACRKSGYRNSELCDEVDSIYVPQAGLKTSICPYHQMIHLDASGHYRVSSDCEATSNMIHKSWFVLPPSEEWYYKSRNANYRLLPPFRKGCGGNKQLMMEFIYPKKSNQFYVPVELDGKTGKVVFEIAHRRPEAKIYWHLDDDFIGTTTRFHQFAMSPGPGKHMITVVDENGERMEMGIEILK